MADKARRGENERKRRRRERGEGEHCSSARQNASLLYERNGRRNPPTKRPASDDVVLTTPSFARTYSPLRAACSTFSRTGRVYRPRIAGVAHRSAPEDLRAGGAGIQMGKESARSLNGQLSLAPFVPRFSLRAARALISYSPHCYRNKD